MYLARASVVGAGCKGIAAPTRLKRAVHRCKGSNRQLKEALTLHKKNQGASNSYQRTRKDAAAPRGLSIAHKADFAGALVVGGARCQAVALPAQDASAVEA